MDEQKLTDWFPPEVLPEREGAYLREYWADRQYWMNEEPDYFDGKHWYYGNSGSLASPVLRWRGLAEPPLTDWFDPDTPPAREGVYEIEARDGEIRTFAHWSPGKGWGASYHAVHYGNDWAVREAYRGRSHRGLFAPCRRWRGLAVQP